MKGCRVLYTGLEAIFKKYNQVTKKIKIFLINKPKKEKRDLRMMKQHIPVSESFYLILKNLLADGRFVNSRDLLSAPVFREAA